MAEGADARTARESSGELMRAAVVGSDRTISTRSVPIPECGPNEVRIRIDACGLCGSDLHAQRLGSWPEGLIPGHEIVGRIDAVGAGVDPAEVAFPLERGLPVAVEPLSSCGACGPCRIGRESICPDLEIAGVHRAGGFAEFINVPARHIYRIDPTVEPAHATLIEPLAVALHAIERAGGVDGERVLVLGGGTVGLLCGFAARQAGAREVAIRARYPHQRRRAEELGAGTPYDARQPLGEGDLASRFDLVIETVGGSSETLIEAGQAASPGGRIIVLGLFERSPAFDPMLALEKELTFVWSNCYQTDRSGEADFARAARLIARHAHTLGQLVTNRCGLDEIAEAFELARDKERGVGKLVVVI